MDKEFKLPDPGEGIHEAEVVEILVSEGDTVEEGQSVLVVETDKAANEVPSPYDGTVKEIRVGEGDMVRVGDVLMIFDVEGEEAEEEEVAEEEPEKKEEKQPEKEKEKKAAAPPEKERKKEAEEEKPPAGEKPEKRREGPVPAAPATRRLARELGVDLHDVAPSGPHGRVTAEDIRAAAEGKPAEKPERKKEEKREKLGKAPPLPDFSQWGPVERKALRSVRRTIAKRMIASWSQIPHVTHEDEVDITDLENFRNKHKEKIKEKGGALTMTPFILKAVVAALKTYPRFNASLDLEAEEVIYKHYYHIGVAVDTENGLLAPVIHDADRKSISDLAVEFYNLAERTRNGEASRDEMSGASFTISNVGSIGGIGFTPIINYPQSAILGIARAAWRPVIKGVPPRHRMETKLILPLSLGYDHRIVDGADAARFMNKIIESLEDPERLIMNI